jgi:hypothetical protein
MSKKWRRESNPRDVPSARLGRRIRIPYGPLSAFLGQRLRLGEPNPGTPEYGKVQMVRARVMHDEM